MESIRSLSSYPRISSSTNEGKILQMKRKLCNRLEVVRDFKFDAAPYNMLVEFDEVIELLTELRDEQIDVECSRKRGGEFERALELNHAMRITRINKERVMGFITL
jgi:hypothetical protein